MFTFVLDHETGRNRLEMYVQVERAGRVLRLVYIETAKIQLLHELASNNDHLHHHHRHSPLG